MSRQTAKDMGTTMLLRTAQRAESEPNQSRVRPESEPNQSRIRAESEPHQTNPNRSALHRTEQHCTALRRMRRNAPDRAAQRCAALRCAALRCAALRCTARFPPCFNLLGSTVLENERASAPASWSDAAANGAGCVRESYRHRTGIARAGARLGARLQERCGHGFGVLGGVFQAHVSLVAAATHHQSTHIMGRRRRRHRRWRRGGRGRCLRSTRIGGRGLGFRHSTQRPNPGSCTWPRGYESRTFHYAR